jgi:hypothetical protein
LIIVSATPSLPPQRNEEHDEEERIIKRFFSSFSSYLRGGPSVCLAEKMIKAATLYSRLCAN